MSFFLFVDESGQEHKESPYEVLAGVAIEDRNIWNLVQAIQETELQCFGTRYSSGSRELKGRKILKRKVFRQAIQLPEFEPEERRRLAKECLESGPTAGMRHQAALAQAKLDYVGKVFDLCARYQARVFASIVIPEAPKPANGDVLRKDYAYMFERYFYFLEDRSENPMGSVVFDELEKSRSHLLLMQMDHYFKRTSRGRLRSGRVIPEPLFVHSDLTTGIQIADLVAYILSWGFRERGMTKPSRTELEPYVFQIKDLRHRAVRELMGNPEFVVWSIAILDDLRSRNERDGT